MVRGQWKVDPMKVNFEKWQGVLSPSEPDMVKAMCLELGQAELRVIGRSRGFEPETIASRELMQHVFLSEQGVESTMTSLTPAELAGLHLLNCMRETVDIEFFKRIYPEAVSLNLYASYNDRFKVLFQEVRARLIQRGLLVFSTLSQVLLRHTTMLERRRFRFPTSFGELLPPPFQPRQLDPATRGSHRHEVLREKLTGLLQPGGAAASKHAGDKTGLWRLENGELRLGASSSSFRVEHLEAWQRGQFEAAVAYANKAQPEALMPVALLLYALSRLRESEWLKPDELLPMWKMALPGAKAPEPAAVCAAGYDWGCVERIEFDGARLYRLPRLLDPAAGMPPESFLRTDHPERIAIRLPMVPLAALERLCEVSRLELAEGELWASPNLLKLSHARAETQADPLLLWLREHHPAFRSTMEKIEQRRGKLIVHENLLVARLTDLALKVMLEKKFGGPGKLVGLSDEFVAFPTALLPDLESWMKRSGHVIKHLDAGIPPSDATEVQEDE
jgi:hypothetical protein